MNFALHPVFTALIAVSSAVFSYWRGRRLLADLDDPSLPERLLAFKRSNAPAIGVSIGLLLFSAPSRLVWALPLLILARMLAAYPLRKALHNETWSVWGYLSFYTRLFVAAFGFWLFVAAAPAIAAYAGTRDWMLAIVLGAVAGVWNARYVGIFRGLLGAEPIDAPEIRSRFAQLVKDCGLPDVALDQVRLRGGSFMNAVALPSTRTPAVVVTDTLLARCDEDEVIAILAHELAHHEQYNPARLKQAHIAAWVFIIVGMLLPSVVRLAALPGIVFLIWPVAIIVGLMLRVQRMQKHETESDLRAVALTRDPEALVRALTKLNEAARFPRRWDAELERHATHPSLARRIQAIRRASGTEPSSLTEPATFVGTDSSFVATFHGDRLEWHEGTSMTHAIHYQSLRELRIDVRSSSTPALVAVDSMARRWTIPLQTGDVSRAQSVLDVVDVHLGKPHAPAAVAPISVNQVLSLFVIVAAAALGQVAVLFTGVLALIQPASQVAAAAGASAIAAAGFAWRDRTSWELGELSAWVSVTLGLGGAALIAMAVASRRDTSRGKSTKRMVAALAFAAGLGWAIIALLGGSSIDIHRNLRERPSVIILTFACAGALAFERSRKARGGSLALALAGVGAAYAGSTDFVDRFVADSFVAPAPIVEVEMQTTSPASRFPIAFYPSSLWLSPSGKYIALASEDGDEQMTIHAGRPGGSLSAFTADDAAFVGEGELLLLERQLRESVLRLIDLADGSREVWTLKVPVRWAALSIDRLSRQWRLLEQSAEAGFTSAEGQIGTPAIRQSQWKTPHGIHGLQPLAVSSGNVIALETRYAYMPQFMRSLSFSFLWSLHRSESSLWSLSDRGDKVIGTSNAELTCHASRAFEEPSTCAAFDGTRTRFFAIDTETQALIPQASFLGHVHVSGIDDRGWLNGWWDHTALALHPATRKAIHFGNRTGEGPYYIAVGSAVVAGVFSEGGTSTVRIHPRMAGNAQTRSID